MTPHRWLLERLPGWEREGLVSPAAAATLRDRYRAESGGSLAQALIAALGSLLIGAGLISIIAFNWDDLSRPARLAVALVPLAATQAAGLAVLRRRERTAPWVREAVALGQVLAAGAALALVSQIYNLPGDWTDLLLPWCLVSLPLAWIMPAHGVAVFYLCGIAIWCVARSLPPQPAGSLPPYGYLPLLAGILPLWPGPTLAARPPAGSRWVLAASAFVACLALAVAAMPQRVGGPEALPWMALLTAAALMLVPLDRSGIAAPLALKPQVLLGGAVLVCAGLAATYRQPAETLVESVGAALAVPWCWLLLAAVALGGGLAAWQGRLAVLAVAGLALLPAAAFPFVAEGSGWPLAIAYSLALLATAVVLVVLEFVGRAGAARLGAALVTILLLLRMGDAELSLLTKGVAFIVIGLAFLAFNAVVSRRRGAATGAAS